MLVDYQKTLIDYSLPQFQYRWDVITKGSNLLLIAELQYNHIEEGHQFTKLRQQLNTNQAACFNTIIAAIDADLQTARFFLQGSIGTSKTFLYYCLYHYYYLRSKIILYIASSSITALLLPNSRTIHSYFWIPINLYKESACNVSKSLNLAKLLYYTSLLIQDKVSIQHHYCFKAVYYMLTNVRFNKSTFGGLPTVLGSDFAQILPVIPQGNRVAVIGACLQQLFLQPTFYILFLRLNMRIYQGKVNQQFAAQVQSLSYNMSLSGSVTILLSIAQLQSKEPFYRYIYPP